MSDELARLRADLEVLERYAKSQPAINYECNNVRAKIARLEAEAADPWREARGIIEKWRRLYDGGPLWDPEMKTIALFDHLTAENDRLAASVAELEAANEPPFWPSESEIQAIQPQDEKAIMDAAVELMNGLRVDPAKPGEDQTVRTVKYVQCKPLKPPDCTHEFNELLGDDDPILDPARVLATAAKVYSEKGVNSIASMCRFDSKDAKPYRLKGNDK